MARLRVMRSVTLIMVISPASDFCSTSWGDSHSELTSSPSSCSGTWLLGILAMKKRALNLRGEPSGVIQFAM